MIGTPRFRALGLAMMPVKAIDTLQPIYGLTSSLLLLAFLATGRFGALLPAAGLMFAKIAFDLAYCVSAVEVYRRWTGRSIALSVGAALVCAVAEPFSFQILRHLGAVWGWVAFVTGSRAWGRPSREGIEGANPAPRIPPR
jgi:hypothetical protein